VERRAPKPRTPTAVATQATSPIDIGGERYWLSAIDMPDLGRITEVMRAIVIRRYRALIDAGMEASVVAAIAKQGYDAGDAIDLFSSGITDEAANLFKHPEVMVTLLWCSLRHEHPKISIAQAGELAALNDMEAFGEAMQTILRLSGMVDEGDEVNVSAAPGGGGAVAAETFQSGDGVPDGHEGGAPAV